MVKLLLPARRYQVACHPNQSSTSCLMVMIASWSLPFLLSTGIVMSAIRNILKWMLLNPTLCSPLVTRSYSASRVGICAGSGSRPGRYAVTLWASTKLGNSGVATGPYPRDHLFMLGCLLGQNERPAASLVADCSLQDAVRSQA